MPKTTRKELQETMDKLTNVQVDLARQSALLEGVQKQLQSAEAKLHPLREIAGEKYKALVLAATRSHSQESQR